MADDEYNKKLESLQQYVPFLNKMIVQLKNPTRPNREQQLAKITSLHSMITEKKKLKLATLTKCEEVILQLLNKAKSKSQTRVSVEEPAPSKPAESETEQSEVFVESPASPSFTPPKTLITSSFLNLVPDSKGVVHNVDSNVSVKDPATNVFVNKSNVFDRLGKRIFYQPKPVISFDEALASFKERLKEQGISLSEEGKSSVAKPPLTITITGTVTTDGHEEVKEEIKPTIGGSEENEDLKVEMPKYRERSDEGPKYRQRSDQRPKYRERSDERPDSTKSSSYDKYKDRRKLRDTSEETEERDASKRSGSYEKRRKFRGTSEDTEDSKASPTRDKYKWFKPKEDSRVSPIRDKYKWSKEKEVSRSRRDYKERPKYKVRRNFRETSGESDDSRTSPARDKRRFRSFEDLKSYKYERLKHRESSEEKGRSYDKYKERCKIKEKSDEREDSNGSYDKYAERRRLKEERRRSVYSRYIYKSSRRESNSKSWTETRHKIKIRTENTSDKYDRIKDYRKYEQKRLEDRHKSLSPSEVAKIKEKYQARLKSRPLKDSIKLEEIPLPTEPAVSDVSESSMCDVDMIPVDMVLSPIRENTEICVENPGTTSLPFPFPTELLKSESTETSNNQTIPIEVSTFIPETATPQLLVQSNDCWNYVGSTDQQIAVPSPYNEDQHSESIANPCIDVAPPILPPKKNRKPRRNRNRKDFRVLREFTQEEEKQEEEAVVKTEEAEVPPPEPKAIEPKPSDVQDLTDDEKQMEIINKFLKKLLENETTRAAASVFIENVSSSLDDEKLKKAVNTVMSPKKQTQARVVNRKLILDDDEELVTSKEVTKKKAKPVIDDDDETEGEITSTVRDDRKASKKKKSELDMLHEDLREMFIHDGILTSTGKRMCSMLKDDTDSDNSYSERRTRSLTKKFDMKSSKNQQQLRILRSARVVIPIAENLRKGAGKADSDEDEDLIRRRRPRKPRCIEDSEEERSSPKRSNKTSVKYVEDSDDDKAKEYASKQANKISWSYAEDDSDEDKSAKESKKEYSFRQSDKVSWSYAEENSDDDKESKKQREYPLRRSNKFLKCYVEIGSDDEMVTKKMVSKGPKEKRKESPNKSVDDKTVKDNASPTIPGSPKKKYKESKCDDTKKIKDKASPSSAESAKQKRKESPAKSNDKKIIDKPTNAESLKQKRQESNDKKVSPVGSPRKKQEQKVSSSPKVIRRKKVSQWALGVIPKLKRKKRDDAEEPKTDEPEVPKKKNVQNEAKEIKLVEPDKNYWAIDPKWATPCELCNFKGKSIALHYKKAHPEYDVLCSRLNPSQAEKAIEVSIEQKFEESDAQVVSFKSHLKYPFQCRFCQAEMNTSAIYFYDHISRHTGEFRHACSECAYGSSCAKGLRMHYLNVHHKTRDNKPIVSGIKSELFGYLCLECNYVQMSKKSVEEHVNIYHLGEGNKIMKINLSSIPIPRNKESDTRTKTDKVAKRKHEQIQNKSGQPGEPAVKKKKVEDDTNAITLLSLLEDFEKNSGRVSTDSQKEPADYNEEVTDLIERMNRNLEEIRSAKETEKPLILRGLLSEERTEQEREKSRKENRMQNNEATEIMKKSAPPNLEKSKESIKPDQERLELSESMKKKWHSLNLDELTVRILKQETGENAKVSLHTAVDLNKKEPSLEEEGMTEPGWETPPRLSDDEEETETIVEQFELVRSPVKKAKKIDMSVFTGKTDLEEENDKIDQERLRKMMQLNETIKKKRQSLSIVEQLSNRLLQDKEAEMPVLEPAVSQTVPLKQTKPVPTSPRTVKKKALVPKNLGTIVMSAGFFDVFKKSNELEFVCRVSPCRFVTKYRDTFVTHLNQEHVKINEEYKITECSACQGTILPSSEKGFLKSFFLHMVDNHLDLKGNEQNVLNVKTIKRSTIESSEDTVMRAGLLDIIKGPNTLNYACRVVFCGFSSKHRYPFITHWNEEHSSFRMTQCRLCGVEIAADGGNNLLPKFFVHLDEEHLGVKSLKLPKNPFSSKVPEVSPVAEDPPPAKQQDLVKSPDSLSSKIPEVSRVAEDPPPAKQQDFVKSLKSSKTPLLSKILAVSPPAKQQDSVERLKLPISSKIPEVSPVAEDPTPEKQQDFVKLPCSSKVPEDPPRAEQQDFVIESVVSLAEPEDKPPFVIGEVISLADDLDRPGPSSKEQGGFVIESVTSLAEQAQPSFVIENVVSLAQKQKAWKSESALKAFLSLPKELYKCPQFYCHFASDSRQFFDMHLKSHGVNDNGMVCCVYCDVKIFIGSAGRHIDMHHQNCHFSCSLCLYRALRKEYVIVHMKLKHKETSSILSLPKPPRLVKSQDKCYALNETCHPYRCGYKGCQAEFLFQNDYTNHLGVSHAGLMFCGYTYKHANCLYKTANADCMIDHWRSHNCYSFHCLICQVGSMELYTMLEHYSLTHPNRTPSIVDRRRSPGEENGYNGKAFAKVRYISNEIFSSLAAKHYKVVNVDDTTDDGVIQIDDDVSAEEISDAMLLNRFGKLCEPAGNELKCPLCVHFKTKKISYFIYHLFLELKCHRFKCNSCDYFCITYGAMVAHCQDEHKLARIANVTQSPIDKPVQFWVEMVLSYQAKVITSRFPFELGAESQSDSRNIQCGTCRKWFRDLDSLQHHELYHWAELMYVCRTCRCRLPSFDEILRHTQSAHAAPHSYSIGRVPSVTKIVSNWKSFTSQPKEESVSGFQAVQGSDSEKVVVLPSSVVGQKDDVLYACLHCQKTVRSVEILQKHNVEAHDGHTDNFKCKVLTKSEDQVMLLAFVVP